MNKICKNCKHWQRFTDYYDIKYRGSQAGYCASEKFEDTDNTITPDTLAFCSREDNSVMFFTGENFGCIHWSPANEQ